MGLDAGTGRVALVRVLLVLALVACGLVLWRLGTGFVAFVGCCGLLWGWRLLRDRLLGAATSSGVAHDDAPFADHSWMVGGRGRDGGGGDHDGGGADGGDGHLDADADLDVDLGDDVDFDFD